MSVRITDGSVKAHTSTHPGALVFYVGDLTVNTDIVGDTPSPLLHVLVPDLSILLLDDLDSRTDGLVSDKLTASVNQGVAYWKVRPRISVAWIALKPVLVWGICAARRVAKPGLTSHLQQNGTRRQGMSYSVPLQSPEAHHRCIGGCERSCSSLTPLCGYNSNTVLFHRPSVCPIQEATRPFVRKVHSTNLFTLK